MLAALIAAGSACAAAPSPLAEPQGSSQQRPAPIASTPDAKTPPAVIGGAPALPTPEGAAAGVEPRELPPPKATEAPQSAPMPFGRGMTAPTIIAGSAHPEYTREAREAHIEGKVIARCTITEQGEVIDCAIIKSLPFLDKSVLRSLAQRRYAPVMYEGKPRRVYLTIPFNFGLQ